VNAQMELDPAVIEEIKSGNTVTAIKLLRESKKIGLKEAKEIIELYNAGNHNEAEEALYAAPRRYADPAMTELPPEVIDELKRGNKLKAIKVFRSQRRIGLKEAKEMIDSWYDENSGNFPSSATARTVDGSAARGFDADSGSRAKSGSGLTIGIIVLIVAAFLVYSLAG